MGVFRLVPPAGGPLPLRAAARSLWPAAAGGRPESLRVRVGARHVFWLSSGRAALTVLLQALRHGSTRREVVIPAYTCFSVPSAIARAGFVIRLCDVDPKTLDLDLNALARLDLDRVLCIVPSGLYGLPGDLLGIEAIARAAGASLVDDAAQCLGARQAGRECGTFGDAGFYSLGRGKGITTMGGGVLVTHRDELARDIERQVRALPRPSPGDILAAIAGSFAYSLLAAPSSYWLVDRVLELGGSTFAPNFPVTRLSAYQRRLAEHLLPSVDACNGIRRDNAERLRSGIDGVEGIEIPQSVSGAHPIHLRFPLLTRDAGHRSRLLGRLRAVGIGASASYPSAIGDIPGVARYRAPDQEPCPQARSIATRILTLPTHPGVTARDIDRMVATVRDDRRAPSPAVSATS
jgi:perosamine synthetase